jgi:hypothetical protein
MHMGLPRRGSQERLHPQPATVRSYPLKYIPDELYGAFNAIASSLTPTQRQVCERVRAMCCDVHLRRRTGEVPRRPARGRARTQCKGSMKCNHQMLE